MTRCGQTDGMRLRRCGSKWLEFLILDFGFLIEEEIAHAKPRRGSGRRRGTRRSERDYRCENVKKCEEVKVVLSREF